MSDFFPSTVLRSNKRLLYLAVVSFGLLYLLWSPHRRTSTLWSESDAHLGSHEALPYTAAIIYLAEVDRTSDLLESLASINRNLPGHPWPIVLFHTGDFDHDIEREEFLDLLHKYLGADSASEAFVERIEFVKLEWRLPKGISPDVDVVKPVDSYRWPSESDLIAGLKMPLNKWLTV
jgi:mannosyltransferase